MRFIALIILISLFLFSIVTAKECFQESATNSTITDTLNCGLKYDGAYGGDENVESNLWVSGGANGGFGHDINETGWHDSDYLTFSVIVQNKPVYVNYSIPSNTTNAEWKVDLTAGAVVELNSSTGNYTIPSGCLNNIFSNILQIKITNDYDWTSNSSGPGLFHASCWNYSSQNWYEFWTQQTPNVWLFEESMWWHTDGYEQILIRTQPARNQNQNIQTNKDISEGTKDLLDITVGLLSLAIVLSAGLWVYKLTKNEEMTLKKMIIVFAYLVIGLVLIQVIASVINGL